MATPVPTDTPAPTGTPEPKVTIYYEENAQFELIGPTGRRVLIDVYNPPALSNPVTDQDILLVTHSDTDHFNSRFVASFPGQQLVQQEGEIDLPEVSISGVASAHVGRGENSNTMFLIELGGLRIAHLGDLGQGQLTPQQLDALGKVDIAICLLSTSTLSPDTSEQVFNKISTIMAQLEPRVFIPTHLDDSTLTLALETWKGAADTDVPTMIGRQDLPAEFTLLMLGDFAPTYQALYGLPEW
jgi:L-ascorbate metabolism protein UlaG (beta-lactamase superfamily)